MFGDVPFGIKLERNCSIDRRVLAVRVKVHAETHLSTWLEDDARAFFEFMAVVADAIRLKIRLAAVRIHGCRTGVMNRFMPFDDLDLDRLHVTVFGRAEIDDNI